jgi:ribosome assembly protein YihI (activator of Der GTPase)
MDKINKQHVFKSFHFSGGIKLNNLSTGEVFNDLLDRINALQKSNTVSHQKQTQIESQLDKIISLLKDKRVRERERGY